MSQDPKSRSPRIEIHPGVWPALQVEAIIRRMGPKDLVNILIMGALSPKAREFMEPMESKPHDPMTPQPIATEKPKEPMIPSPHEPIRRVAAVADNPDKEVSTEARTALSFILEELEKGNEPTVNEIADKMGLTTTGVGRTLSACGIKAKNTHRDNKTVRIYTKPMKATIEEVLETTK